MDSKQWILRSVEEKKAAYIELNDRIWEYAETAFIEFKSMDALCAVLAAEGFAVEKGVGGIATAFTATWGSGKPVIGFLGEYDALSGLNQKAGVSHKEPTAPEMAGQPGHGCAHNCLGVACLAGAVAAKEYLAATGKAGTLVYYGCPGEEGGSGKAFMARAGVFEGLDAALAWHGYDTNHITTGSMLANYQVLYKFKGVASHAAAVPHLGRSALDAVALMDMGVQYLREHILSAARIHYALIDTGGYSPNVVQPTASALYLIRAPKVQQVAEIYERVNAIAEGAAQMTETTLEIDFIKACTNLLSSKAIERTFHKNLSAFGAPQYTAEEYAFADRIIAACENHQPTLVRVKKENPPQAAPALQALFAEPRSLNPFVLPYYPHDGVNAASSDIGDVSQICPTAQFNAVIWPAGCPPHAWQLVACTATSIAHKGMLYAGKVLGATAVDLIERPELLAEAKAEFEKAMEGRRYKCPIPDGVMPRALGAKM